MLTIILQFLKHDEKVKTSLFETESKLFAIFFNILRYWLIVLWKTSSAVTWYVNYSTVTNKEQFGILVA